MDKTFPEVETLVVGPLAVCCYLVYDPETRDGVIIDPGGDAGKILSRIEALGLRIGRILATHGHADHVVAAEELRKALSAPFALHKADDEFFRGEGASVFLSWGFPPNPPADETFEEGAEFAFGRFVLRVLHTPGHSPGSVCFYDGKRLLFTGDTLFVGAVGRGDLPGGDYFQMMRSIREKLLALPEDTIVFPGHDYGDRPTSTIGREKRENPFIQEGL
ncbi:MBL fold metallo-hydrolase [Thermosulfurimonas sp. F29]|uniref:MBL fold metallo-hydrolase n=1 Tax=Thermosulfurimonas sp. F29 TaxID=2867247 RepID=UPI001C834A75|nr:MBL fold metallo-hydrolase [Thermosulfurimonas sp. F29]MBX6423924.1 MBL fold metallo-hydrolase [Thermosulfurimonas sp. F29]